jgi:hypothetical protein
MGHQLDLNKLIVHMLDKIGVVCKDLHFTLEPLHGINGIQL